MEAMEQKKPADGLITTYDDCNLNDDKGEQLKLNEDDCLGFDGDQNNTTPYELFLNCKADKYQPVVVLEDCMNPYKGIALRSAAHAPGPGQPIARNQPSFIQTPSPKSLSPDVDRSWNLLVDNFRTSTPSRYTSEPGASTISSVKPHEINKLHGLNEFSKSTTLSFTVSTAEILDDSLENTNALEEPHGVAQISGQQTATPQDERALDTSSSRWPRKTKLAAKRYIIEQSDSGKEPTEFSVSSEEWTPAKTQKIRKIKTIKKIKLRGSKRKLEISSSSDELTLAELQKNARKRAKQTQPNERAMNLVFSDSDELPLSLLQRRKRYTMKQARTN